MRTRSEREPADLPVKLLADPLDGEAKFGYGPIDPARVPAGNDPILPFGLRKTEFVPQAVHAQLPIVGARVVPRHSLGQNLMDRIEAPSTWAAMRVEKALDLAQAQDPASQGLVGASTEQGGVDDARQVEDGSGG